MKKSFCICYIDSIWLIPKNYRLNVPFSQNQVTSWQTTSTCHYNSNAINYDGSFSSPSGTYIRTKHRSSYTNSCTWNDNFRCWPDQYSSSGLPYSTKHSTRLNWLIHWFSHRWNASICRLPATELYSYCSFGDLKYSFWPLNYESMVHGLCLQNAGHSQNMYSVVSTHSLHFLHLFVPSQIYIKHMRRRKAILCL